MLRRLFELFGILSLFLTLAVLAWWGYSYRAGSSLRYETSRWDGHVCDRDSCAR